MSRLTLLPSDNDVTKGLITWPRRLRSLGAGRLGVLGGILGTSRHRSFGRGTLGDWDIVLDDVVSLLIRLWAKDLYPRHARRSFSTVVGGGRTEGHARRQISLPIFGWLCCIQCSSPSEYQNHSRGFDAGQNTGFGEQCLVLTRIIPHARQCRRSSLCGTPHPYLSRISLAYRHKSLGSD